MRKSVQDSIINKIITFKIGLAIMKKVQRFLKK